MGIYTEYLDSKLDFNGLSKERKKQLRRISKLRGKRDVLVYAANLNANGAPISVCYDDLLPFNDQLANLNGDKIDVVIETPGGSGEVVEDIVRLLRGKYKEVAIIVPGWAKSAGTLMAMAGDEILMEPVSGLGPIDAQLSWQGKVFSAHALLEGMDKIKEEVATEGLSKAYIPILQAISPGELQSAQNALDFAKELVTKWLADYKFKNWDKHSSNGNPVTLEEKRIRAEEIATQLCDHGRWLTHGRSIKLDDFEKMKLKITDYSLDSDLADAIRRYYTLVKMTFDAGFYKIFETPISQIYKMQNPAANIPTPQQNQNQQDAGKAVLETTCTICKTIIKIQANLGEKQPLDVGNLAFPSDNKLKCPKCGAESDITNLRIQVEAMAKKPIVS